MRITDRLASLWDKAVPWLVAGLGLFVLLLTIDNHILAQANNNLAQQGKSLAEQNLNSQNHHHASTVKKDAQLQQALNELKASAAAIQYEGGVIAYQGGEQKILLDEVLAAQAQGHALLMAVAGLQMEINQDVPALKFGLNVGQMEISNFLHYTACLGTHPTDIAVCGTEPPLPSTS